MQKIEPIERVFATLEIRDPVKTTLCVGSAAIAAHLAEANLPVTSFEDVDVLCSHDYFLELCRSSAFLANASRFQVRYPHGTDDVKALSPVADVHPIDNSKLLPFSACEALGGTFFPVHFSTCMGAEGANRIATYRGYKFLGLDQLLLWTAVTGRQKDLDKLAIALPLAQQGGLLEASEIEKIHGEIEISRALRGQYPGRRHARIRNGD